ncbi:MAG: hypothetical protein ABI691_19020 [Ginsengibacter sp.]
MPNWTFQDFLSFTGALIVSIGGAGVIILGLSKWFGDLMASRILQKQIFKHEKELEDIKSKFSTELEETKSELDKSKALFYRYSEKQFELYNALWKVLWNLKKKGDELWEYADPKELPSLSKNVSIVKEAVNVNILIIEEDHYKQLNTLIEKFEKFDFGKKQLVELRNKSAHQVEEIGVNEIIVRQVISDNGLVKQEYDHLIKELAKSFRKQIKG